MALNDSFARPGFVVGDAYLYPAPGPLGPPGPPGPRGETGPASALPAVWSGPYDPPEVVPGAKPGDTWINTATGDTYTLT